LGLIVTLAVKREMVTVFQMLASGTGKIKSIPYTFDFCILATAQFWHK
jgi:hypothetical protein